MNNFLTILKAIITGIITGFIISIPLGPAGIESVKRTVLKGYKEGFTVSIGALCADFSYLMLINLGLARLLAKNKKTDALFWIISGGILFFIGYKSIYNNNNDTNDSANNSTMPLNLSNQSSFAFLTGFLITFSNPMTPSLWLFLSGTIIRQWYCISITGYYVFIGSIMTGMVVWFALLNYLALKGIKIMPSSSSNLAKFLLKMSILVMGLCFIIYGIIKLIVV